MADQPSGEPMDIRTACIAAHEQYTSLCAAGFDHPGALYLVASWTTGGPGQPPTHDGGSDGR
ncbi:MAG: hypothetical protein ACRDZU_13375 [Acidimicrobiales bacterium]